MSPTNTVAQQLPMRPPDQLIWLPADCDRRVHQTPAHPQRHADTGDVELKLLNLTYAAVNQILTGADGPLPSKSAQGR